MKNMIRLGAILLAVLSLSGCLAGRFMSNYALTPTPHGIDDIERTRHKADSLMPGSTAWYDSLTAIVVHGYGDNHLVFLYLVRMYRDEFNYNVLFPDLQYHGYSEGDHVQMGWYDRLDIEKWIPVAHDIFKDDFMVLHGVSMGAATVMMTSGDNLPEYVRAFVEDCGYASVVMQFNANRKQSFAFIPPDVLQSASVVTRSKYGWGFWEASSVKQLAKCDRPMLFIHGDADDFVPFSHLQKCYDAKVNGYKEMWVAPGAVHANSFAKYPEEYKQHVRDFLAKVKAM